MIPAINTNLMIRSWPGVAAGAVLCLFVGAAAPRAAWADDAAEARLHFDLASRSLREHNYDDALTHFLAAHRLAPTANTIFNIAQTYTALQRPVEAYRFFRDYLAHPSATAENRARAERAIADIAPQLARVTVTTDPPGATLYVDRVELGDLGQTPRSVALPPDAEGAPHEHTIIVRRAGYREARATVDVARGAEREVTLRLEALVATVRVVTDPAGATVELDGHPVEGVTPLTVTAPLGAHQLRIRSEGRLDVVRELSLDAEGTRTLDERLPRDLARASVLSVVSPTPGATVRFRDVSLGAAPLTRDVESGAGTVRVEAPGRTPWTRVLLLQPGRGANVRVTLGDPRASRPLLPKLFTFGGAAVAVAGGILGALALSSHSDFDQSPSRAALDRTQSYNLAADVTLGVGLATLVGGVVAWVLSADPSVSRGSVTSEALDARP